jgi:hypothetical protein
VCTLGVCMSPHDSVCTLGVCMSTHDSVCTLGVCMSPHDSVNGTTQSTEKGSATSVSFSKYTVLQLWLLWEEN